MTATMTPTKQAPAPAKVRTTRELIETIDRDDGMRFHRYRWTVTGGDEGPISDTGSAWQPIEPLSREILEDRWRGMLGGGDTTKLGERLDNVLRRLAEDLTRRDISSPDSAVLDGEVVGLDLVMDIDGLEDVIREWMIERAAKVAQR